MFRLLSVVDGTGWGGTKAQVYYLARELGKRGLRVDLALNFDYTEMIEKLKPYGVGFKFFEKSGKHRRLNPANYYRLWRIISEGDYSVVIANSPHALDYVSVVYRFLKRKPKLVVVKRSGRKPNPLSLRLKYLKADVIVCVSESVKEVMRDAGAPEEKLKVIRSGIDLERFYPRPEESKRVRKELGIPESAFVFMNVSNWNPPVKGQDVLIRTFSELRCKDCFLVLVGYDTDTKGRELALRYGVEDRVLGLGFGEDVERLLSGADCFVLSSFLEGFPNALLQAMAEGLVCISTDVYGAKEIISDGYDGFLVKIGDGEGLTKAMENVYNMTPEERKTFGERAVQRAKEFSAEKNAQEYLKLFEELCF